MTSKAALSPHVEVMGLKDRDGKNHATSIMDNFWQILHLLSGHLGSLHIADHSIVKDLLGADVFLCRMAQVRYTGDGTANRTVTVSDATGIFTPTEISVLAKDDVNEFYSRNDGTETLSWYRLAAGTAAGNAVNWQGLTTNGFKCGSGVENLSNKTGQVYSCLALKRG